ncbi:MAG: DUF1937 family protein [Candidatus Kapabacteria bacterium]|nr:DUF1937 family protein [Candidatus Kapabacteria bacterium]
MIYYLATPYSDVKLSKMRHRYVYALVLSEELRKKGYVVYSPIVHWHVQTHLYNLPPEATFWEVQNKAMMNVCDGIIVPQISHWGLSDGVIGEIADFTEAGKEVIFYVPEKSTKHITASSCATATVTYEDIVEAVSKADGFARENVFSKSRKRRAADNRHLARYLFMVLNNHITFPEAGRIMDTDHSTIYHSLSICDDKINSIAKDKWFISVKDKALQYLAEDNNYDITPIPSKI